MNNLLLDIIVVGTYIYYYEKKIFAIVSVAPQDSSVSTSTFLKYHSRGTQIALSTALSHFCAINVYIFEITVLYLRRWFR